MNAKKYDFKQHGRIASILTTTVCLCLSLSGTAQSQRKIVYLLSSDRIQSGEAIFCVKDLTIATNTLIVENGGNASITSTGRIEFHPGVNILNGANLIAVIEEFVEQNTIETDAEAIRAFPNPSQGILNIQSRGTLESIQVRDMNGNRVLKLSDIQQSGLIVDISKLDVGFYMLEIADSNGGSKALRIQKK